MATSARRVKVYCTCGKTSGYTVALLEDEPQWDLWVCNNCRRPSQLVFRKLTNMRAPYGAETLLSYVGHKDGRGTLRWKLGDGTIKETLEFYSYPRKVDMNVGESLLLRTWELLDSKVDVIMSKPEVGIDDTTPWIEAKLQARGIAETLAILMQPFIVDADEVVRHAVKRYKARQAGELYEVPGLAEHIWDPTKNWDGSDRVLLKPPAKVGRAGTVRKLGKQLTEAEKDSVRTALAAGMFTVDQLAATFKVTAAQIEACR